MMVGMELAHAEALIKMLNQRRRKRLIYRRPPFSGRSDRLRTEPRSQQPVVLDGLARTSTGTLAIRFLASCGL